MTIARHSRRSLPAIAAAAIGMTLVVAGCATGVDSTPGASETTPVTSPTSSPEENECGDTTIDHSASITSAHDLLVDAPVDEVWNLLTDVEGWAGWQQAVTSIERLDEGDLASSSQFRWTTPVPESQLSPADTLTITSTVLELDASNCVLWEGPAVGQSILIEKGVHLWTFTEVDGGTLVHTEESWDAALLDSLEGANAQAAEQMLGGGLAIWLDNLKVEAERE